MIGQCGKLGAVGSFHDLEVHTKKGTESRCSLWGLSAESAERGERGEAMCVCDRPFWRTCRDLESKYSHMRPFGGGIGGKVGTCNDACTMMTSVSSDAAAPPPPVVVVVVVLFLS